MNETAATVADLLRSWRGSLRIMAAEKLTGARRALLCKKTLWVSPAMFDLLGCDNPDGPGEDEMLLVAENIHVTYVANVKQEYRVAFAPED